MEQIYLDYNASTPLALEVVEAMTPFLDAIMGIRQRLILLQLRPKKQLSLQADRLQH